MNHSIKALDENEDRPIPKTVIVAQWHRPPSLSVLSLRKAEADDRPELTQFFLVTDPVEDR